MSSDPQFSTLIVTYNNESNIQSLLTDIYQQAPPPQNQIVVVDNASVDRTVPIIKSNFPGVLLIANQENIGFGSAVNQGFLLCGSTYFFLINPDIRIIDPNFFSDMIKYIEKSPSIGAIGPVQFKESSEQLKLNFTWSYWNPQAFLVFLSYKISRKISRVEPIKLTFLNAGCLLIRSSAFRQIGMFNQRYFMYGEEPDLFLKLKIHDYICYLVPSIQVIHYREHSIKTLSRTSQILLKLDAVRNISHALASGVLQILMKKWNRIKGFRIQQKN